MISSAKRDMLRQARLHQGFGGQAQYDEVVILGKVNHGGAEELLKGQGRGTMTTQFRLVINNSMKSLILLYWVPIILVDVGAIV